jgi:protein phosphatase
MKCNHCAFRVAALTHRGAVRDHNEDTVAVDGQIIGGDAGKPLVCELAGDTLHLLLVADGMGGHACGELASRAAIETLRSNPSFFDDEAACSDALLAANDHIYDLMRQRPDALGMGTTIVGAALSASSVMHFNVGDSRAYRHSSGKLVRLSHDDVPPGATERAGRTSHLITQSLGGQASRTRIVPHVATVHPLKQDETLLLCSDGLTDMIGEEDILRVLGAVSDVNACVLELLELSLDSGGLDNISAIVARRT